MTTLVLAAHPDDETLGCGGTIAKLTAAGEAVHIAVFGEGATSRAVSRDRADTADVQKLAGDAERAGRVLGAASVTLFGLPDNRFDTVPLLDVVKLIEGLIEKHAPATIYTQHGGDLNIDHAVLYRATLTAARPLAGSSVRAVYGYEVGSSTEWAFGSFQPVFAPNRFVDIDGQLETKLEAMRQYTSETRPFPHPRSEEAIRAAAVRWGAAVGVAAAEAFQTVWERA